MGATEVAGERRRRSIGRLAVYTDYVYHRDGGAIYAERAFALFLARLAGDIDKLVVVGRLHHEPGRSHYRLPRDVAFAPLPYYGSVARPLAAVGAMARSLSWFWRVLTDVDAVWILGPHPLSICFVAMAALRRKRVTLGVRQDTPAYARSRHPGRPLIHFAALAIDRAYRALARAYPVVVVGPALADRYRRARRLLEITVSLIGEADIVAANPADERFDRDELTVLSVGRLDSEKNPLMLADVLVRLHARGRRWRLVVCGDGPLAPALERRLEELGLADHAELRGYVPIDGGLRDIYRQSDLFLHVSWTEGLPQVLVEAFAAGLPVVATDVGGVARAVGDAALLVPPGDPDAAADGLARVAADARQRAALVTGGTRYARSHTTESESRRLAAFLGRTSRSTGSRYLSGGRIHST